ncbi:hypothetical protein SMKC058_23970 [Serratia marcescens]|nr:hypothetical protein SMKC058_23970 [Serratia marcescens]
MEAEKLLKVKGPPGAGFLVFGGNCCVGNPTVGFVPEADITFLWFKKIFVDYIY